MAKDYGLDPVQVDLLWSRWRGGESVSSIARAVGRPQQHLRRHLAQSGGMRPPVPRPAAGHLSLGEREEISRGIAAGLSSRGIGARVGRPASTISREIARHGGVAVCSPIAPFAETRDQVQQMVEDAGGAFFLVHVATPLEECERRDRKGLYAKARAGEIPEFTGISSPYEEPVDPAVRVDTTGRAIEDALDDVLVALDDAGYLRLAALGEATA